MQKVADLLTHSQRIPKWESLLYGMNILLFRWRASYLQTVNYVLNICSSYMSPSSAKPICIHPFLTFSLFLFLKTKQKKTTPKQKTLNFISLFLCETPVKCEVVCPFMQTFVFVLRGVSFHRPKWDSQY